MRKLFILLAGVFIGNLYSQNLQIKYEESPVYKLTVPSVQNDYILPAGDGKFITISTKRKGFLVNPLTFESYFDLYDNNLKKIKSKKIRLNNRAIKGNIKGAFVKNNKLNIIKFNRNLRQKYYSFEYLIGDIQKGEMQPAHEFFRISKIYPKTEVNLFVNLKSLYYRKLKYYSDVYFYEPKIFVQFSDDNSFFTIIYRDFQEKKTKYFIDVFNDKFEHIYQQTITEEVAPDQFSINDILIDKKANVFMATKLYRTSRNQQIKFAKKTDVKSFHIYKISKNSTKYIEINPKKIIEKLALANDKNRLFVLGFYRNEFLRLNDVDGVFRANIDKNNFISSNSFYIGLGDQVIKINPENKKLRTKNHEIILRNLEVFKDGSIIMDAEDYFIPLVNKRRNREIEVREIVGDLISLKVGEQGNLIWANKIYKRQIVKPRLALHSCFSGIIDQKHILIFTDTQLQPQDKKVDFYLKGKELQNLNGVIISSEGNIRSGILIEHLKSKFRFIPIEGTKINNNEIIIPAKNLQFIKFYKLVF